MTPGPRARGVTYDDVCRLATKLPKVEVGTSWGTSALKVDGKFLARLKEDGETLAIKMDFESRDLLLRIEPEVFYLTDHYRGYPAILVRLPEIAPDRMEEILEDAWRFAAPKKVVAAYDAERATKPR